MKTENLFIVCCAISISVIVSALTYYNYHETAAMQANIENAISKGIDPVAVRCAYANEKDVVCVAYGVANHQNPLSSSKK
mgnify:CR=1 FL=1